MAAGKITLLTLQARVPDSAPYGSRQLLDLSDLRGNGQSLPEADDDALHIVGYLGDTNRNAQLDKGDVTLLQRNALRLDNGFAAWTLLDPRLIGDIDLDGRLTTVDASRVTQEINGVDRPEIPNVPVGLPIVFAPPPAAPTQAGTGQSLPQIDFGSRFVGFTVGSDDPRARRENWKKTFVTHLADNSVNPNSQLRVTLKASLQSTPIT